MSANKYGSTLTVILIIAIVIVIGGGGFLFYNYVIKPYNNKKETAQAISEFDKISEEGEEKEESQGSADIDKIMKEMEASGGSDSSGKNKKVYYQNFVMIGYITIPKTNVKLPILEETTPKALDTAVAVVYPSNPKLNEVGNTVIIGHNYRNGKFFSNNNKLSVGDKVLIKDITGRELTYIIYQKFEAEPTDASFYNRNTNGIPEITLSTCTDDSQKRIIIFAKAQ